MLPLTPSGGIQEELIKLIQTGLVAGRPRPTTFRIERMRELPSAYDRLEAHRLKTKARQLNQVRPDHGCLAVAADSKPVIYRNFIEGIGPRGIACGNPEQVNLAWPPLSRLKLQLRAFGTLGVNRSSDAHMNNFCS